MIKIKVLWRVFCALVLLTTSLSIAPVQAENLSQAETLLQTMSPEERVGQLFLVTFNGTEVEEGSEIYELITKHHIGGVVLLAENNNFISDETVVRTQEMIESLHQLSGDLSLREPSTDLSGNIIDPTYIPLFIGLKQLGNGYPGDQILSGLTELPSQMAIGASWDLNLATQVGEVLGSELRTLGINLFLGPNLDVLETANSEAAVSLGVNTYGGDPFWVGEMGKAFISGLHIGSNDRLFVVAQNFPGTGNSDRSPEFEVSTVRKSLEQLKQIELAPYFSVTTPPLGDPARVDAVMLSHIRYQGFQGNIRATTRPISFDSNAFQQIMSLPQFASWREAGGLIISDNLGSGAVRRFFDPNNTNFDARQIARNAFLAGNDILFIDGLVATGDPDAYTTLSSTLEFFAQKYREDAAFAKRVDTSVLRILSEKLDLFGEFSLRNIMPFQGDLEALGQSEEVTFNVAQNAVTRISPSAQEFDNVLPRPPLWYENMIIFTDVRTVSQCEGCPRVTDVNTDALSRSLIRLYGPQASGQILNHNLASYTFSQLVEVLENFDNESVESIASNLRTADWVIFNTLDVNPVHPASNVLQRILAERPDLLSGKNVIVFAMDSPTYLDATNISKITAYYALYSKADGFLDVAARVLMQEIDPAGALPVSLNAVGYDLISMTAPDPNQVIRLSLVLPDEDESEPPDESPQETPEVTPEVTQTPEPTAVPGFNVGDTITVQTGQIYDHNHNVVPDGTIVRFNFRISGEPGITQQFEASTNAGVALINYRIESAGSLEINATSEPAIQSETLLIDIFSDGSASVFAFTPTPQNSPTSTEIPTTTPTVQPEATSESIPARNSYPTLGEWALSVIVLGLGGVLTFLIGFFWWGSSRWGLRSTLCALIGGLMSYTYLNLGIQGIKIWLEESGTVFVVEMVVVGLLLGWIGGLIWWMRTDGRYPSRQRK